MLEKKSRGFRPARSVKPKKPAEDEDDREYSTICLEQLQARAHLAEDEEDNSAERPSRPASAAQHVKTEVLLEPYKGVKLQQYRSKLKLQEDGSNKIAYEQDRLTDGGRFMAYSTSSPNRKRSTLQEYAKMAGRASVHSTLSIPPQGKETIETVQHPYMLNTKSEFSDAKLRC